MDKDLAVYAETLFDSLEKYKTPKFQWTVRELRDIFQPMIDNEKKKEISKKHLDKYSYGKYVPTKRAAQAVHSLTNAISLYEEAYNNVHVANQSQIDLLHKIEILDQTEEELLQSAKELQEIQAIRREAKDFVALMEEFYEFSKELKEKGYIERLGRIISAMNQKVETLNNRTYKVREKTALAEAFQKAKSKAAPQLVEA